MKVSLLIAWVESFSRHFVSFQMKHMTEAFFVAQFPRASVRYKCLSMVVLYLELMGQNIFVCRCTRLLSGGRLPTNKNFLCVL
jgi:hypothetical protein